MKRKMEQYENNENLYYSSKPPQQFNNWQSCAGNMRGKFHAGNMPWRPQRGAHNNYNNNNSFYRDNRSWSVRRHNYYVKNQYFQKFQWQHMQQQKFLQESPKYAYSNAPSISQPVEIEHARSKKKAFNRKPLPQSCPIKPWNRADAVRACSVEKTLMKRLRNQSLVIKFPDPELNKEMVKKFHDGIENVHFQIPSGPRFCFVQLNANVDPAKVMKELQQIKFGNGKLIVHKKLKTEYEEISPEHIDPYSLYIGNIPDKIPDTFVKEKFSTAARVYMGFAQKMKRSSVNRLNL